MTNEETCFLCGEVLKEEDGVDWEHHAHIRCYQDEITPPEDYQVAF